MNQNHLKQNHQSSSSPSATTLYLGTGALLTFTILSGIILSSSPSSADAVDSVSVTVNSACTMSGGFDGSNVTGGTYSTSINPGTSQEITGSKLVTVCNDPSGYSIYAIGYSDESYDAPTNTQMIGAGGVGNINTGTSGNNSYWAMKLSPVTGITSPQILNGFDSYHNIPSDYTQIAKYTSNTTSTTSAGAAIQTNYKIFVSPSQSAGTYTGKVKYTMVHPNDAAAPVKPASPSYFVASAIVADPEGSAHVAGYSNEITSKINGSESDLVIDFANSEFQIIAIDTDTDGEITAEFGTPSESVDSVPRVIGVKATGATINGTYIAPNSYTHILYIYNDGQTPLINSVNNGNLDIGFGDEWGAALEYNVAYPLHITFSETETHAKAHVTINLINEPEIDIDDDTIIDCIVDKPTGEEICD